MTNTDHLNSLAERIDVLIKVAGGVTSLSKKAGVSRASIDKWRKGNADPSTSNILALAHSTNVSEHWLFTGDGPMRPGEADTSAEATFPSVPRYNVTASAGNGRFADNPEILDQIPFTQDFLNKRLGRTTTKGLIAIEAVGDSMEPTIGNGDLIMIDTHQTMLNSGIYAFTYEDAVFVKRLNPLPDRLTVMSDNKAYDPFSFTREQMNDIKVIGKVVWVGHML